MTEAVPVGMRLQKYLSRAGRASRREAERLMAAGRVRVNGEVVFELGTRVTPGTDVVELDGERVDLVKGRWIAFNKPPGVLTTRSDPHGGRTVYDALPPEMAGLRYVGRLDRDAEGLILFTNDGDAAHSLQHPSGEVEREYHVEIGGTPTAATLRRLVAGVELEDGMARAKRAELLESVGPISVVRVVLTEGRKREVRRMFAAVNHNVLRLKRTSFGPVSLGDLGRGAYRELDASELAALDRVVGRARRA